MRQLGLSSMITRESEVKTKQKTKEGGEVKKQTPVPYLFDTSSEVVDEVKFGIARADDLCTACE